MSSTGVAAILAFAAGLGGAVQIAVQGRLGERVGSLEALTTAGPRIGVVATSAFLIAGQFCLATLVDRYGWLGVERAPVSWSRAVGIALLLTGALLTLRR